MTLGSIALTEGEQALLAQIDFRARHHDELVRSCNAARMLTPILLDRDAIPARRVAYFTDPALHTGKQSRLQIFEQNGTSGDDIFAHGNLLRHLEYFIHGARLPPRILTAMLETIGDPAHFTSDDLEPVRKLARQLTRSHGLDRSAADAFFLLMNDLGLSPECCHSVRRAVLSVR